MKTKTVGLIPNATIRHTQTYLRAVFLAMIVSLGSQHVSSAPDEWIAMKHFVPANTVTEIGYQLHRSASSLACRASVQVSLNQDGWALVTPGMLVPDPDYPLDQYVVDIMGPLVDTVFCDQIGMEVMAVVEELPTEDMCMSTLIVEDKLKPVLQCTNDTLPCNTEISELDFLSFIDTLYDNCDEDVEVFYVYEVTELDCDPDNFAAFIEVTYTAEDNFGNVRTCQQIIFLEKFGLDDVEFPADTSLSCVDADPHPDNIGGPSIGGEPLDHFCELVAWYSDVVADMCDGQQKIFRTWNVMDWCTGETESQVQEILIVDTIPPVLTCPDDITLGTDPGECFATYTIPFPDVSDLCSDDALIDIAVTFNTILGLYEPGDDVELEPGQHIVTISATDDCNNTATCQYEVEVVDDENPVLVCSDFSTNLNAMGMSILLVDSAEIFATDNCALDSIAVRRMDDNCGVPENLEFGPSVKFCCADIGQVVMVIFQAIDEAGNIATCMVEVTVKDVMPPEALCRDLMLFLDEQGEASITVDSIDAGSTDNCEIVNREIDITDFDCDDVGPNVVTLTVEDQSGNTGTCTSTVTVKDSLPPTAVCVDITVQLDTNGMAFILPHMVDGGSTDNCELDTLIVDPDMFDCDDVGPNEVQLIVVDVAGASDTCTAIVTVEENPPTVECMDATVYLDENGMVTVVPDDVDAADDDCGVVSRVVDPADFTCDDVGMNVIVLTVTDTDDNTATCSATVTVIDSMPPECLVQAITVQLDANGMATIDSNAVDDGSNDECGLISITVDPDTFDCSHVGPVVVMQTVTDSNGNTSTCTVNITVEDNIDPECLTENITVFLDQDGEASIDSNAVDNGSNDACGIQEISVTPDNFLCGNVGTVEVTQTVTDVNGNTATCTANVTVVDTISPTCLTQDITVFLDANGMASIASDAVDNGSSDACGLDTITVTPSDFTCADVGAVTVTQTVTDINGNTSVCTATVMIEDTISPVCIIQDITVQLDGNGMASITGPDVDNGSNDACGISTLAVTPDSFACEDVGVVVVVLTVTDVNGNTSSCSANVTVEDNVAPICLTQDITIQLDPAGMASIDSNEVDNGSSDACGIAEISLDSTAFSCDDVGTVTVTQTVTDVNGNTASCTAQVTVEDVTDPICSAINTTVQLDASGMASIDSNEVDNGSSDACGLESITVDPDQFNCMNVGTVTVTQTVTDVNGNTATCTSQVTVEDNVDPTCVTQDITVQLDANGMASIDSNAVDNGSSDACGVDEITVDPSTFTCEDVGTVEVTQTVTDVNGNTSTCSATVTVVEDQTPICSAINITVHLDANGMVSIDSNGVDNNSSDACGIAEINVDQTDFTCLDVGQVTVTQTVTDVGGNTATCTAVVTVIDSVSPTCITQDITIQLDVNGMASIDSNAVDDGSSDACGLVEIDLNQTMFDCDDVGDPVVVVQTVTDVNGNTSTCTAQVTVEDNEDPVAVCTDITVFVDANGMVSIVPGDVDGGSSANCGDVMLSIDETDFTCDDLGPNVVTLTVEDASGGTSTCTATVTVVDTVSPECVPLDITVSLDANGEASITAGEVDGGASDNCGPVTVDATPTDFTCTDTGPNTVVLTVTDGSGNTSTCTATVTVVDDLDPVCVAQDITVFLDGSGNASIDPGDVDNGSTDNCLPVTLDVTPSAFTCDDLGPNVVTLTVTDPSGNTSTCTSTVTVVDDNNLVAICQDVTVNLDVNGMVSITADIIDNGSGGGCAAGEITLELDDTDFDCSDTGPNVVTLTVTDQDQNTATCTAVVTVVDNLPPVLTCPENVTVNCEDFDPENLPGMATVDDNCPNPTLDEMVVFNIDLCNAGTVVRTFTATDASGNIAVCTQTITVENPDPFTEDDIIWPDAVINLPECSTTDPGDIPDSQPVIDLDAGSCANVSVNFSDSTVTSCDTIPATPCIEVYRTWTVVDSCQLEPGTDNGIFTYEQAIFVNDSVGPMFTALADVTVEADTATCTAFVSLMTSATACDTAVVVTNDFNDGGGDASDEYPVGTTTVTFTAEDGCCNVSTMTVNVNVVDPVEPTAQCNKVIFNIPEELDLTIHAEEFVTFTPGACADPDDYYFSYSNNDPFDSIIMVGCGQAGDVIPIDIYIFDPTLMMIDSCLGDLDLRDSMMFCTQGLTITGVIHTEENVMMEGVQVHISDDNMESAVTSSSGRYTFGNLQAGNSYTIAPYKNDDPKNGVSVLDLITIQKHLLGLQELSSPYQRIAADATHNGKISALDLIEIQRLLLGQIQEFSNNTSWRFVEAGYVFPDPYNPFMTEMPESMGFTVMSEHYTGADFIAVKVGDVNSSVFNLNQGIIEVRAAGPRLVVEDRTFDRGALIEIPVYPYDFRNVAGYQFDMTFSTDKVAFETLRVADHLDFSYFALENADAGYLRTLWHAAEGVDFDPSNALFTIVLRAHRAGSVADILSLVSTVKRGAEAYIDGTPVMPVRLDLTFTREESTNDLVLLQNRPNPFSTVTTIPYYISDDDRVELLIHSIDGRVVYHARHDASRGYNSIEVDHSALPVAGIYYYTVITSKGRATRKMTLFE